MVVENLLVDGDKAVKTAAPAKGSAAFSFSRNIDAKLHNLVILKNVYILLSEDKNIYA